MPAASGTPSRYTTTIAAAKTVGECQHLLAQAGASAVAVTYADRIPSGLSFRLAGPHGDRDFSLPVSIDGMFAVLREAARTKKIRPGFATREQAVRVAWRVLRDWLEAQLALIAARQVALDEIMLPFLVVGQGKTLYAAYRERETALELTAGGHDA